MRIIFSLFINFSPLILDYLIVILSIFYLRDLFKSYLALFIVFINTSFSLKGDLVVFSHAYYIYNP